MVADTATEPPDRNRRSQVRGGRNAVSVRRVGILGGMGPAATADFYTKLIRATPAGRDQEHLPVVIWADPRVPDRSAALLDGGEDPTPVLRRGVAELVRSGCEVLAVPCNTAHAFLAEAIGDAAIDLVSIVEAAAGDAQRAGITKAGLLATAGTAASGLHAEALAVRGVGVELPTEAEQQAVTAVIAAVKAGTVDTEVRSALLAVVDGLAARGADGVISACTEVILALDGTAPSLPVIDPAVSLATQVVAAATSPPRARGYGVSGCGVG